MRKKLKLLTATAWLFAGLLLSANGPVVPPQLQTDDQLIQELIQAKAGPQIPPAIAKLEQTLSHPSLQSMTRVLTNPVFVQKLNEIAYHPNRMNLLYFEVGWFIFFLVFKAWRLSRLGPGKWMASLWFRLWASFLYMGVSSFAIPVLVLGKPYMELLHCLFD
jgi:hypothetical protein